MELPTNRADYSKSIVGEDGEIIQVHDSEGREIPDPVPMAPPLGYTKPLSMFDQMRAQIRQEHMRLQQLALEELAETPEQANDFDVEEDIENQPSLYEEKFDPVDYEIRQRLRQADFRAKYDAAVDGLPSEQRELLNGDALRIGETRENTTEKRGVRSNRDKKPVGRKDEEAGVSGGVRGGSEAVEDTNGED